MSGQSIGVAGADQTVHSTYRPDIDGLRAIAVLSVVAFHAFPNLFRAGFVGVDVFFVLSGFLISTIILQQLATDSFSFAEFYARRVRRIFPALLAVLVGSLVFGWVVLLPDEFQQIGKHVFAGTTFVSNLVLWNESGYFDNAAETKPLLHLWSLAIEEQFYLLWPLLLAVAWRRRRRVLPLACLVAGVSFLLNIESSMNDKVAAFYSPLTRFWELMTGAVLAYVTIHHRTLLDHHAQTRSVLGFILLLVGFVVISPSWAFPGWSALLPTIGTALIVSAGPSAWLNRTVLANRPAVWVGLISYPLYLWHWPLLVWPKIASGELTSPVARVVLILVSAVLAWLTYRLVEIRVRKSRTRRSLLLLLVPFGTVGIIALAAALGYVGSRHQGAELSRILASRLDWSFPGHAFSRAASIDLRYFVAPAGQGRALFVGDSNMEQYAPRLDALLRNRPDALRTAVMVGNQRDCSLLKEIIEKKGRCDASLAELDALIRSPQTQAVVLTASWRSYADLLAAQTGYDNLLRFVSEVARTSRVYLVLNMPNGKELDPRNMFEGSRLTRLAVKDTRSIVFDTARFDATFGAVHDKLRAIAKATGAIIVDPLDTLCKDRKCSVFDSEGRPLYLDEAHMTASYAARAATFLDPALAINGR